MNTTDCHSESVDKREIILKIDRHAINTKLGFNQTLDEREM